MLNLALQLFLLRPNKVRELLAFKNLEKLLIDFTIQYNLPIYRDNSRISEGTCGCFISSRLPYVECNMIEQSYMRICLKEKYDDTSMSITVLAHEIGHFLQYRLGIDLNHDDCELYANKTLINFIKRLSNKDKFYLSISGVVFGKCYNLIDYYKKVDFDVFDYVYTWFRLKIFQKLPTHIKRRHIKKAFRLILNGEDDE